jgi:hypothetical protein
LRILKTRPSFGPTKTIEASAGAMLTAPEQRLFQVSCSDLRVEGVFDQRDESDRTVTPWAQMAIRGC